MTFEDFWPFWFVFWLLFLLYRSLFYGQKTSHLDEDIDDYWSDG